MARRVAGVRQELALATAAVVAVASTLSSAALVEAVNDRDWSIGDWEWLDVTVLALVSTFGALWLLLTLAPRVGSRRGPTTRTPMFRPVEWPRGRDVRAPKSATGDRTLASSTLGLVDAAWAPAFAFAAAVAVWWLQAIAIPLGPGRDFHTYIGAYVELFQRHPIDLGYALGRTPIAPLVTGGLLDIAGGALAEPVMSLLYALAVTAWFVTARRFGALPALVCTAVVLVYPSYGLLFHELASDSVFAAAFAGWSFLVVRVVLAPSPVRFALVGAGIAALVLVRPGNQALLVLALLPLALDLPWRSRVASAAALAASAVAVLGLWAVHNGALYGDYTVATGGNARLPFERAFLSDRIVRPDNGPASRKLAALVQRDLLTQEPYRAYGVTVDDFFSRPTPRLIVDLSSLSNRLYGWKSDGRILRDVGIEAVRRHPETYSRGVAKTVVDQLWQPIYRPLPANEEAAIPSGGTDSVKSADGETIVVHGRRLPKPTEGELIPAPHDEAPTTANGGISTVWTSPTERHLQFARKDDEARLRALHDRMANLSDNLPDRTGNATLALRLDQASHWFPPPLLWLIGGLVALAVRRPKRALAAATPAIAGMVVIVLSALAITAVPHYSVPFAPAFALLAAVAIFGSRRPESAH